eukprot:XP_001693380.1 predicted protein [Chlamydomonas reinhardtii]
MAAVAMAHNGNVAPYPAPPGATWPEPPAATAATPPPAVPGSTAAAAVAHASWAHAATGWGCSSHSHWHNLRNSSTRTHSKASSRTRLRGRRSRRSRSTGPRLNKAQAWVGYHKQLEAVFATMHGEWDKAEQQWVFPVSMYKHVMASLADGRLRHRGVDITLNQELGPPAFVLRMLEEAAGRVSDERLYDKLLRFPEEGPNSLDSRMMPFQRDGWLKLTDKEVCVISGKEDIPLVEGYKMDRSAVRVFVVSYDTVSRTPEPFEALKPRMVVLDEAHYIKASGGGGSMSAQRTKMVMPIVQSAKRAVLLTGTPAANKPMEIMALLVVLRAQPQPQALVPKAKIHQKDFGARYARQDKFNKFIGSRNEAELNRLLLGTGVMIRRLKSEVLKHLPPKRRQQVGREGGWVAGVGAQREQQNEIMQLWRQNAKLKGAAVAEYCEDLLEGEDPPKFLLFGEGRKLRFKYIRIDGDTPGEDRNRLTQKFQEEEDVKVALLSIKAAGVGLTFTRSSLVVFSELSWIPGDIQQAEDRCHRIGQAATSVNIHYLLVRGSVDEIMWDCLQSKLGSVGKALDGSGAYIKAQPHTYTYTLLCRAMHGR